PNPTPASNHLTVRVDGKMVRLAFDDILFIEGLKEYVRFVCRSGRYVSLWSMKNLETALPAGRFLRVHKSFIVNAEKVRALEGNRLDVEGHMVPVSRQKREEIVRRLFGGG
ncbi:MAG: LytTR family transcriptional regulator, partial [Bacteroidetes bacterium]